MNDVVRDATQSLVTGARPDQSAIAAVFEALLSGEVDPVLTSAFLTALRARGETVDDVVAGAQVMRAHARLVDAPPDVVDTCGTGGLSSPSFNTSTAAAIAAAAAGAVVAKHGNRSTPPKTGSADVLEALGVNLTASDAQIARCFNDARVAFLFAQSHHAAVRYVAPVRRQLGFRTIFNLLGPLANPAGASRQLLGVSDAAWAERFLEALARLGTRRAWVVHGLDGLDEITTCAASRVHELADGSSRVFELSPEDFGLKRSLPEDIVGGSVDENSDAIRRVFEGEPGPFADLVIVNAAAALIVSELETQPMAAASRVRRVLESGAASETLSALRAASHA
ncbi:anthranilate phosphoribosyltransferase [bacterium]|nr:anthranilate phosphoribosyltransferase [bacterium]